jgi:limonene-1,2-epoxide hydrolase
LDIEAKHLRLQIVRLGEVTMSAREEKIVTDFIGQFRDSWPPDMEFALSALAEDAYYQIVVPTIAPIRGRASILAELRMMQAKVGPQKHEMKSVGSGGHAVFTERVDHSQRNGKWSSIPLVAVFEVNSDGKIYAWREYLDLVHISREHGITSDELIASLKLPMP